MATEFSFKFPLPAGLHARPASAFARAAKPFVSEITFINDRTGMCADAKSVLAMIGISALSGDPCRLVIEGTDEPRARDALSRFVAEILPHADDPPASSTSPINETGLPRCLHDSGAVLFTAKSAVPGIGVGRIVRIVDDSAVDERSPAATLDPTQERERLLNAMQALDAAYVARIKNAAEKLAVNLLQAHQTMSSDPALKDWMLKVVSDGSHSAIQAVAAASDHFAGVFLGSGSVLLRERALDVRDVCRQLIRQLRGATSAPVAELAQDSVLIAEGLTPSDLLGLDRKFLKGLALSGVGATSHTVILAQSFGIPCVIDVANFSAANWEGKEATVDGELGIVAVDLTPTARRYYEMEQWRLAARKARAQQRAALPGQTADGARLEIAANISSPDEVASAIAAGAESVGLFRTEMLFMDRSEAPREEEQVEAYSRALRAAQGRMVIIRTLDIGGDKPVAWLELPSEQNPMLGIRGTRLYPQIESCFRTQLRALLRASVHGQLRVMIPMIAQLSEARWVRRIFNEERTKLVEQGTVVAEVPLGAMIEIPSAAFEIGALCREMDFFSIGSNDLIHYFTATDRGAYTSLDNPLAPGFLQLLTKIVDQAHAAKRWVGLCGDIGGDPQCLPFFVGLGLDEISVAIPKIGTIKNRLAPLVKSRCAQLLKESVDCLDAEEVRALVSQRGVDQPSPLLVEELVVFDSPASTKAEAIKALCDRIFVIGRTERPGQIENDTWLREANYTPEAAHGVAIPHCKTRDVAANSLCVLKAQQPIPWGKEGAMANFVFLLVIRECVEAEEHLRIISHLARLVLNKSFREKLAAVPTPAALTEFLNEKIKSSVPPN
ncbi:MAG TPA: phosphoenolpyruvate--protein phosphotransferase [Verrucomicrobiae bacterium]